MTGTAPGFDPARFFTTDPVQGALLDRNGDGFPDGVRARLVLRGTPSVAESIELIHLAARLGLETGGCDFPLAQLAEEPLPAGVLPVVFQPAAGPDQAAGPAGLDVEVLGQRWPVLHGAEAVRWLWRVGLPDDGVAAPGAPLVAASAPLDLARLYDLGGVLADDDGDTFPERARVCFVVPPGLPVAVGAALLDVAARVGLAATGLRFPLAVPLGARRPAGTLPLSIVVAPDSPLEIPSDVLSGLPRLAPGEGLCTSVLLRPHEPALLVLGDAGGVTAALRELAATWPHPRVWSASEPEATDLTVAVAELLHGEGALGRAALLGADLAALPLPHDVFPVSELRLLDDAPAFVDAVTALVGRGYPALRVVSAPDDRLAFVLEWADEWEVARVRRTIRERVLPALDPAYPADLLVLVSEPAVVRQALAQELRDGGLPTGSRVRVLSAFKPGLCWLREVIAPAWVARGDVARVVVRYRRFVAPVGQTHLDLPIRWLQELYPADELLAAALGVPLGAVTMVEAGEAGEAGEAELDGDAIYVALAFDVAGHEVAREAFSPRAYVRPYLDAHQHTGQVLVTTGAVVARQGERIVYDEPAPTDLDRFWSYYQATVLPRVHQLIVEETGGGGAPIAGAQPFFDTLDIEVWASEPDEALGIRQELVSSAEALHEDIYFATLDAIAALGNGALPSGTLDPASVAALDAPGAVRPFIHVRAGMGPRARVTLRRRLRHLAEFVDTASGARQPLGRLPPGRRPAVAVRWATWQAGVAGLARLGLAVSGAADRAAAILETVGSEPFHELLQQYPGSPAAAGQVALSIALPGVAAPAALTLPLPVVGYREQAIGELPTDAIDTGPGHLPLDVVIGERELRPLLARLAALPGVVARRAERSLLGRDIPVLEVLAPPGPGVWSRAKAALYKPTLLAIGRHHANEVAATPAALRLAALCATDPAYRPLLDRVNLVLLPYENPDGAALHYAMQREHPTWKLHAARYNAVGLEFARDFFNPDSPYGEARARQATWRRWRPDVVVDNHGVPSHEWNQLFNGFNSPPRFPVSYWLPQALLYGIVRHLDAPAYRAFVATLRERVGAAIAAEPELHAANRELHERYGTWGHDRLPTVFPATYYGAMLWYISALASHELARFAAEPAYFRVTTLSWVTEVPDETAQGDYLTLVARAHLVANTATLRLLAEGAPPVERIVSGNTAEVWVTLRRQRPLPSGTPTTQG